MTPGDIMWAVAGALVAGMAFGGLVVWGAWRMTWRR